MSTIPIGGDDDFFKKAHGDFDLVHPETLRTLRASGFRIIQLVTLLVEAPSRNAHYTEDIREEVRAIEKALKQSNLSGDGGEPPEMAREARQVEFQDLVMALAHSGFAKFSESIFEHLTKGGNE